MKLCANRSFAVVNPRKTYSCPFVQYFRTLFWDDITMISWWKLSKQISYWSKTDFFFSVLDQWKVCFLFQLVKLRKICEKNWGNKIGVRWFDLTNKIHVHKSLVNVHILSADCYKIGLGLKCEGSSSTLLWHIETMV